MMMSNGNGNSNNGNGDGHPTVTAAAPLYITIGPPCCGKTTLLSKHEITDVSLDDQPGVYREVDTRLFLLNYSNGQVEHLDESKCSPDDQRLLQTQIHGKSLQQRISQDNVELRWLLQRWAGLTSPQNFAIGILHYYHQRQLDVEIAKEFVQVVEDFFKQQQQQQPPLPSTVQLFCVEALFRPDPTTKQSGIDRALQQLRNVPRQIPVAWGNTNTKARDYYQALELASVQQRPIHFWVFGRAHFNELPHLPLHELLRRNLQRLATCGKYIPANAIQDMVQRVDELVGNTTSTLSSSRNNNDATTTLFLQADQLLVTKATPPRGQEGFRLLSNRSLVRDFGSHTNGNRNNNNNNSNNSKRNYESQQVDRRRPPPPGNWKRDGNNNNNNNNNTSHVQRKRGPPTSSPDGERRQQHRPLQWQQDPQASGSAGTNRNNGNGRPPSQQSWSSQDDYYRGPPPRQQHPFESAPSSHWPNSQQQQNQQQRPQWRQQPPPAGGGGASSTQQFFSRPPQQQQWGRGGGRKDNNYN
jgi:hypothetical protein